MQGRVWEFLGDVNNAWSLKGFLVIFISLKILQYLEIIISKLWILVIVGDLLRAFIEFWKSILFIESRKISKLVVHLNSCSMDLGRDKYR